MEEIEEMVTAYRLEKDRRGGSRSCYYNLLIKEKFDLGVTKFEQLMSEYKLTLAPLNIRIATTRSSLQSWNYENLTDGLEIQNINELVVGDLTYIIYGKDRYYLFCLTDVYSGRIVGHSFSTRMRSQEAKITLDRWITLRGADNVKSCIHHTDGGGQYFSSLYLGELEALNIQVSVAKNCLQNGYAEQRNGLFKHHLLPTVNKVKAHPEYLSKEIDNCIDFYNNERMQEALHWKSPVNYECYLQTTNLRPVMKLHCYTDTFQK
jgi:transposase InsO family protein